MQPSTCPNCAAPLQSSFAYCPQCSQKTFQHRLTLGHLGHDLLHFFTHADKGILVLIRDLAVRPGTVAREYVAGRRTAHYSPLSFFFVVLGVFVLTLSFFHTFERPDMFASMRENVRHIPDAVTRARMLGKLERAAQANRYMDKYANFVAIVATPLVALIFLACYPRRGYNFTEHLVANLYFTGFCGLVFIFVFAPLLSVLPPEQYLVGVGGYLLLTLLYRAAGYYGFIGKKGKAGLLHAFGASLATVAGWYILSGYLITHYINKGFSF
jgi:hypothetical protein